MSTFLHDVVVVGDELEVRGPIGGWFVWDGDAPALLVGGGSGLVPLMAMLRLARDDGHDRTSCPPRRLGAHARRPLLRRRAPRPRDDRRLHARGRAGVGPPRRPPHPADLATHLHADVTVYVCGSAPFAEAVGDLVLGLGVDPSRVRVERFGPSA